VRIRATDRLAMAHNASHSAMTPAAVLTPTSEIGLTRAAGHPYRHVLELLEIATVAAPLGSSPVAPGPPSGRPS
jgi:hypothetical protein